MEPLLYVCLSLYSIKTMEAKVTPASSSWRPSVVWEKLYKLTETGCYTSVAESSISCTLSRAGCYAAVAESSLLCNLSGSIFPGQSTPNLGLFAMLHLFSFPVATVSHAGGSRLTAPCKLQDPGSVRTQAPGHGTPWGWRQDLNRISLAPRLGSEAANRPGLCTWRPPPVAFVLVLLSST